MAPILRGERVRGRGNRNRGRGLPALGPCTRSSIQSTILGSFRTVPSSRPVTRSVGFVDPLASTFALTAPPSHIPHTASSTHDPMTASPSHDPITTPSTYVPSASRPYTRSVDPAVTTVGCTQLPAASLPLTCSVASNGASATTSAPTRPIYPLNTSSSDGQSALDLTKCAKNSDATSQPPKHVPTPTEQQLLEKIALLEKAISCVKDTLHAHGLILSPLGFDI